LAAPLDLKISTAKQIVINIQRGGVSRDKNSGHLFPSPFVATVSGGMGSNIKKIFPLDKVSEMK
jgi:hypothetical protein